MHAKLNWPLVVLGSVLAASLTALAITHVIPGSVVVAVVTGIAGWLTPSPVRPAPPVQP